MPTVSMRVIRRALACATSLLAVAGCGESKTPPDAAEVGDSTGQSDKAAVSGSDLYRAHCAACHAEPPDLRSYYEGSLEDVHTILKNGRGNMPAFELSDEEIKLIYDFVRAAPE